MNPLTVCRCQPILSIISARVAQFLRWSMATTWAVLLPSRGPALSFALVICLGALAAFFAGVAFFGAAAFGLAPFAVFWPLDSPFFVLAPFLPGAFSGATLAPDAATAAAVSVVSVVSVVIVVQSPSAGLPVQDMNRSGCAVKQVDSLAWR